jgi:lipopolysaccharide transport system permease protein
MGGIIALWRHRVLLRSTVLQGIKARTSGNVLGLGWLFIYPLLFLMMYSLVYIFVLKIRVPDLPTVDYVLTIFCGLVPFLAFSEAFGCGTVSLISNPGLLRNTLFPAEMVVAKDVIIGCASMGIGMLMVWLACLFFGHIYLTQLAFPFIFILQIIMTLGLVWIVSSLAVFFRDLRQAIPIIILFLMLVSPIAYTASMVPNSLRPFLILNPLAWLMHLYRSVMLEGVFPTVDLCVFALLSFGIFSIGFWFISRLKPLFADYV